MTQHVKQAHKQIKTSEVLHRLRIEVDAFGAEKSRDWQGV